MEIKLEGANELRDRLQSESKRIPLLIKNILNKNAILLQNHIRQDMIKFTPGLFTGGTSDDTVASRSGLLRKSTKFIPAEIRGDTAKSGINFGAVYAGVHIGPRGQTTTIKPKGHPYLAIPLPAAQYLNGAAKGGPRDSSLWGNTFIKRGNTFIKKSQRGNLIIFGQGRVQKGKNTGNLKGDIVPLFLLKQSVSIKARLFPSDMMQWVEPKIIIDFKKEFVNGSDS